MLKLLTIYLSISGLIYMQLGPAYAQDKTGKAEEAKGKSEGKDKTQKELDDLTKEEGSKLKSDEDKFKVTEASEDTASIVMTVLFMLVIMISAPLWLVWCPKPDTGIHALAGVLAIVLEGVFWGMYERGSTQALEIMEKTAATGYDAQIDSMKVAMEITLKAKTWMTAKFGAQVAIAILIGVAMAVVLIMSIMQVVRSWGTEAAIAQNCTTAYNDSPFKTFDASRLYTNLNKPFELPMGRNESIKRFSGCTDLGELAFLNDEMERFSSGKLNSAPYLDFEIIKKDKQFNSIINENKSLVSQFNELLKNVALMPTALAATTTDEADTATPTGDKTLNKADIGAKLAAIGVAVPVIIAAIVTKVQSTFTFTAWNGWIRAGFYGAEIVFMSVIASFSKRTADKLGERADEYQRLYEQLATILANPSARPPNTPAPIPPQTIVGNAKSAAVEEMNGNCFVDGPGGGASPDPSCGCKASKTCKKSKMPSMKFPDFKTPGVLASTSNLASDFGDKVFSGDMSGASIAAAGMGRNAVAMKNMNDKLKALANSKLVESGRPPIDFKRNESDMVNKFKKAASDTWKGLSSAQKLEATQAVMGGSMDKKKEEDTTVAAIPTSGGKSGAGSGGKKRSIFDLIEDKDDKLGKDAAKEKEDAGKGLEEYEDSSKQIADDGKASLFKLIEIRYMKSAYPVFFENKEK